MSISKMAEKCIICGNSKNILFRSNSYMRLPVKMCGACGLYYSFGEDKKIRDFSDRYYKENYWSCFRKKYTERRLLNFIIKVVRALKTSPLLQSWHYSLLKPYLPAKKRIKFLDIGCGDGESLKFFSRIGFDVYGVEMDANKSKEINSFFKKKVCINGDIENLKLKHKFDVIYLSHVIEHLSRPDRFLESIKQNLKNGGVIFIEVPNCGNRGILHGSIVGNPHVYHLTARSMNLLFTKHGYDILKLQTYSERYTNRLLMLFLMLFKMNNYDELNPKIGKKLILIARQLY